MSHEVVERAAHNAARRLDDAARTGARDEAHPIDITARVPPGLKDVHERHADLGAFGGSAVPTGPVRVRPGVRAGSGPRWRRWARARNPLSSSECPPLEAAITTSPDATAPRLPCSASAGCRNSALTVVPDSPLAAMADLVVLLPRTDGADPGGIAAMGSSLATAAWGDALAMVLMRLTGYSWSAVLDSHPSGAVGRLTTPDDSTLA
jgi:hypothetical protein